MTVFADLPNGFFPLSLFDDSFAPEPTIAAAAGAYTVPAGTRILYVKNTDGAAKNLLLPASIGFGNYPLLIKDALGNAGTYTLRIIPNGTEKIDVTQTELEITSDCGFYWLQRDPDTSNWLTV